MTLLQSIVIAGSAVWGLVALDRIQTPEEEKQRTEQHARENYENANIE